MNFSFGKERLENQERARAYCAAEIAPGAADLDAASPEQAASLIRQRIRGLAEAGLLGLGFPEESGGSGEDLFGPVLLLQELGGACASTALAVLTSVGLCARALQEWGTPAMREQELRELLAGRAAGAFGALEPGADVEGWAVRTAAAAAAGGVTLTGTKSLVINAPLGGIGVYPASLGGEPGLYRVKPGAAGLRVSPAQAKMGCRGVPTADVTLTDCPAEKLPAESGSLALARLRCHEHVLYAALCEGLIRGALVAAGVYARDHQAGGKPLVRHQEISFKLADGMVFQESARMLIYRCVWLMEQGDAEAPVLASAAKAFAAESAAKTAAHAVQIFGGDGCLAGSPAERFYRDAKLLEILGDTTEKHRMHVADRVLGA